MSAAPVLLRPLLAGAVAAVLALLAGASGALDGLERAAVDGRFAIRGAQAAPEVAVVDLGDAGIRALGGRWPLPRSVHARLIDRLRRAGARRIAYDIEFAPAWRVRADDAALLAAMARARGVVLATMARNGGPERVLGGRAEHRRMGALAASALLPDDPDGVMRRMPPPHGGMPAFSAAVAAAELGPRLDTEAAAGRTAAWIDYAGPPSTILTIPFEDVLRRPAMAARLRGRVVVVGSSARSLGDWHAAPTSGGGRMPGAEIQANAIRTALRGYPLRSAPGWLDGLATLAVALAAAAVAVRKSRGWALLPAAAWAVAAVGAFAAGTVLAAGPPLLAAGLAAAIAPLTQPARTRRAGRGRREAARGV